MTDCRTRQRARIMAASLSDQLASQWGPPAHPKETSHHPLPRDLGDPRPAASQLGAGDLGHRPMIRAALADPAGLLATMVVLPMLLLALALVTP